MDKAESKFRNTAKKMDKALMELLNEKPFSEITITELCDKAGVYRTTFYSHYDNMLDLLNEVETEVLQNFFSSFDHLSRDGNFLRRDYLDAYLGFIEKNDIIFKTYLQNINLFDSLGIFNDMNKVFLEKTFEEGSEERNTYKALFVITGITSIASTWLSSGCKEPRSEIVDIIMECLPLSAYE